MKRIILAGLATILCVMTVLPAQAQQPPKEITEMPFLHDVVWHLYRWYLDENDADKLAGKKDTVFWVKGLSPKLDAGDNSLFGEIMIPDLDVDVSVKKADYSIPELNLTAKNDRFKIINVARPCPKHKPQGYKAVKLNYKEMRDYASGKRAISRFPSEEILRRFQSSAADAIRKYLLGREKDGLSNPSGTWNEMLGKEQALHLAPVLDIANETWGFWETGKMLIRFSSDIDLENPAVWDRGNVAVRLYNIAEQTVISLDEVPGSNAYMTRDQVGRALLNCMVLGKKLQLDLPAAETRAAASGQGK